MNRQELLTNFVQATNGKGRAMQGGVGDGGICSYFPKGHPGCGIGSQPGFRERFEGRMGDERTIKYWLRSTDPNTGGWSGNKQLAADLKDFFGVEGEEDIDFLHGLQQLHDSVWNWNGLGIDPDCLNHFCVTWKLQVPEMS